MTIPTAFFSLEGGAYEPTPMAQSAWSPTTMNGPAVVAAAARGLELAHGHPQFQPARLTVDLFSQVRMERLDIVTSVVREGKRIRVADALLRQGQQTVARASLVQLRRGEQPRGELWTSGRVIRTPPEGGAETHLHDRHPVFHSDGVAQWGTDMGPHQNAARKRVWQKPFDVVVGEGASPFQRAVTLAESTSLMAHWGSEGIGFINADLTVSLARLPVSEDLGLEADEHLSVDGVAVGTATLYDRGGVFGTGTVVAVSNARRQIDFSGRPLFEGHRSG